ncbi:MAG: dihydrolipoamide acetyltransferase family protein, partial [Pyrinomonadaceae bacterium]
DEDISALLSEGDNSSDAPSNQGQEVGARGRETITKEDPAKEATTEKVVPHDSRLDSPRSSENRLLVSPLAARMAAENGINLQILSGTGPGGRIVKRDIETAIEVALRGEAKTLSAAPALTSHDLTAASPFRDESVTEMRRTIARRLSSSIGPVPHFFLTTEIEMDRAMELRKSLNEENEIKISVNDLIIKIAAASLIHHPQVNASFQEKSIRYFERADIGVAVALEEGLITPVIRSADLKSIGQIAMEIRELAERARNRKLRPEEYTGATFSVSNLGMFGIDQFTGIINPPESAILAIGSVTSKPVVRDEQILIRQLVYVTMSCDHRIVDGAAGAKFLQTFKKLLENPALLLL